MTCVIDPQWWPLGLAALAVLAGAVSVRTTGMGFALLSAPFLVMALGPLEGILVTNVCGIVAALLNLIVIRADLDWRRAAKVVPAGIVGTLPGALLVLWLPAPVLAIAISLLVIAGLLFTLGSRSLQVPNSFWVGAGGGFASGLMTVTAGVGGPGLVIYALATQWEHRSFAATAQLHFAVLGAAALIAKWSPALAAARGMGAAAGNAGGGADRRHGAGPQGARRPGDALGDRDRDARGAALADPGTGGAVSRCRGAASRLSCAGAPASREAPTRRPPGTPDTRPEAE